jgi:IclR family acetate operon transcriptional repressor
MLFHIQEHSFIIRNHLNRVETTLDQARGKVKSRSTVEKAIDILFHLHAEASPRGVTAVGKALDLPKASAHRLLSTLTRRGLLERDERGRYSPGIGLVALGLGVLEREPVVAAARPVLELEAQRLGDTVFLTAARGGSVVVLDKAEGTGFLRAAPRVGSSVPLHATAVGKLHLTYAPEAVALGDDPLEAFTPSTTTSSAALAAELERVRRQGFAENRDEWIPGLSAIAAPVLAARKMVAALAVATSTPRLKTLGSSAIASRIVEAARRIGERMEGRTT